MARKKVKKPKMDSNTQNKVDLLKKLLSDFKTQATEYESYINSTCVERCNLIEKLYMDQLKNIPKHMKDMTIAQIMELQEKEKVRETECPKNENAYRMEFERQKLTSEQKRTHRKEKKRSISVPASGRAALSSSKRPMANNMSCLNRTVSETSLLTPLTSKTKKLSTAITPKFNPNIPVTVARKPKPGETLMSLSGSPIRVLVDDLGAEKSSKVTLSIGHKKVIIFGDDGDINVESDILNDGPLKEKLQDVQQQLIEILQR